MRVNDPNALVVLGELFNNGVVKGAAARGDVAWRNVPSDSMGGRGAALHP